MSAHAASPAPGARPAPVLAAGVPSAVSRRKSHHLPARRGTPRPMPSPLPVVRWWEPTIGKVFVVLAVALAATASAAPRGKSRPTFPADLAAAQPRPACHAGHHELSYHGGD